MEMRGQPRGIFLGARTFVIIRVFDRFVISFRKGLAILVLARKQTKHFDETHGFGVENLFILVSKDV